jgi:hypothetical protein
VRACQGRLRAGGSRRHGRDRGRASQPLTGRPGRLSGTLELSNRAIYQPFLADSVTGAFNERLIDIAYQRPQPFQPAFTTPGERDADRWLSTKLHLTAGDVRADFVLDFSSADWPQAATELNDASYPGTLPDNPFSAGEFAIGQGATPDQVVMALGRDINFHAAQPFARTPPATLMDPLFQPADQPIRYPDGLAMYKPEFLSAANFAIHTAPPHRSDCS